MSVVVISLHDVAPATLEQSRAWLGHVEARGLRATLLVVPGPWRDERLDGDPAFAEWLHAARRDGHELSLHGWEHRGVTVPRSVALSPTLTAGRRLYGRIAARGCGEFHELGRVEAKQRLRMGRAALAGLGIETVGFTPPGWLISRGSVHDLQRETTLRIPAVSHRPGSAIAAPAAKVTQGFVAHRVRTGRPVRIALHPDDLTHPALVAATERMLDTVAVAARTRGVQVVTYAELVGDAPAPVDELVAV
jgi:predicted deacetylase